MDINEYSSLMIRTAPAGFNTNQEILHAAMGISGEAGEIMDHLKKVTFNDRLFDRINTIEEIGDVLWYMNLMVYALDTTWEEVMKTNVAKLSARYPGLVYSHSASAGRDVVYEKAVMESTINGS